jgi:filamentous hemagglutinin family protein
MVVATPAIAQLIPDATLGAESSVVTPGVPVRGGPADLIEGGAPRGGNLFHSFDRFDIFPADRVYFANPAGVDNILTRVTGPLDSLILGTLGVDGAANLFLLNPNGVYFGPDVQLDIAGSLLVSTANRFTFADGSEFSVLPPPNEVLTVSVPLGVQFNASNLPQNSIQIAGDLTIGGDLRLLSSLDGLLFRGGKLTLQATNDIRLTNASVVLAEGAVNGRAIGLNAGGDIIITQSPLSLAQLPVPPGDGGSIALNAGGDIIMTQSFVNAAAFPANGELINGGAIALRAENIELSNSELLSYSFALAGSENLALADPAGTGGPITLDAKQRIAVVDSSLNATSFSVGDQANRGGDITLNADGTVAILGSRLASGSFTRLGGNAGDGGAIAIDAGGDINLDDAEVSSYSFAFAGDGFGNEGNSGTAGNGGPISLMAGRNIQNVSGTQNVQLFSFAVAQTPGQPTGNGGNVLLEAGQKISDLSVLTLASDGISGNATMRGRENLLIQNFELIASADIEVPNPFPQVDGEVIGLDTRDFGQSGDTTITSAGSLTFEDVTITSDANGDQPAGAILVQAPATVTLNNSEITSNANRNGRAGEITFLTPELTLNDESVIAAIAQAQGAAGRITLQPFGTGATLTINFNGEDNRISSSSAPNEADASGATVTGNGGQIVIAAPQAIAVRGQGDIKVETNTAGNGGNLTLSAPQITLDAVEVSASTEFPEELTAAERATLIANRTSGRGGNIEITTTELTLLNGSEMTAATSSTGDGGNFTLSSPTRTLTIRGNGSINVNTENVGRAGTLALTNFSDVTIDGVRLSASTSGAGAGGDVTLQTSRLTFENGGAIAASTAGPGNGGNLTVTGNSPLTLQGNGRLTVASLGANSGQAGNLTVRASDLLRLRNGVELSVTSESSQGGGNINIDVDNGSLVMSSGSFVNATSTNPNAGDGGNVTITLNEGFLIGAPGGNTDIIANAVGGNGGNINISALRLFGFSLQDEPNVSRLRGNNTNDISASSQVGLPGSIALDTLALDPSQGLTELPLNLEDRADQIAPGCGLGNGDDGSEFVVTGRGGLPLSASDPLNADGVTVPWVVGAADESISAASVEPLDMATPTGLVEAQGVALDAAGQPYLLAPQTAALPPAHGCATAR